MRPVINKKPRYEIVPVGDDLSGIIYLEKRGSLTVGEASAVDMIDAKRQKAAIIASKLVKKISVDRGVTIAEAQELLSPTRNADSGVEVDNSAVIYDYIEDFTELNSLSAIDSASVSIAIATLLIQKRVAFPVELLVPVAFNSTQIKIAPVNFYLKDRQVIKFGDCLVVVNGNHEPANEQDYLNINVLPVSENLEAVTGFLYNKAEKKYQVGTEDWTEEDTKGCSNEFVGAIYKFYENERSRWQVEAPVTNAAVQGEQQQPVQLTGVASTGESNLTGY
jgi:hypothetical protein